MFMILQLQIIKIELQPTKPTHKFIMSLDLLKRKIHLPILHLEDKQLLQNLHCPLLLMLQGLIEQLKKKDYNKIIFMINYSFLEIKEYKVIK
jgi:hypothetical protein